MRLWRFLTYIDKLGEIFRFALYCWRWFRIFTYAAAFSRHDRRHSFRGIIFLLNCFDELRFHFKKEIYQIHWSYMRAYLPPFRDLMSLIVILTLHLIRLLLLAMPYCCCHALASALLIFIYLSRPLEVVRPDTFHCLSPPSHRFI